VAVIDVHSFGFVAKAVTPRHGRILETLGVSRVIFPARVMAIRIAHSLVMPNVIDYIELSRDFSIVDVPAPEAFVGRTLKQLELRPRLGLTPIAIKRHADGGAGVVTNIAPAADEAIRNGDAALIVRCRDGNVVVESEAPRGGAGNRRHAQHLSADRPPILVPDRGTLRGLTQFNAVLGADRR
jgi:trk system potassium uptake protein TrkA